MLTLCFGATMSFSARAQRIDAARIYVEPDGWSIGTTFGLCDMWGDVGTKSPIDHYANSKYFDKVCFMGGMFGRYNIHPALAVRMMVNYGTAFATDRWNYDKAKVAKTQGDDAYQRYARNQTAKANIEEAAGMIEIIPFRLNPQSRAAHRRGQLVLGGGLGIFHYTPYSTVGNTGDNWVATYDLHVEGQNFGPGYPPNYSLWSLNIPLMLAYRWDLGQHLNLGIEYTYRMTFTDYLDGVSGKYIDPKSYSIYLDAHDAALAQEVADKGYLNGLEPKNVAGNMRGNPSNKDGYSTFSISLYYKVPTRTREWWHM